MEKLSRVQVFEILFLNLKGEIGDDIAKVQFGFDQRIWLIAQEIAQSTDYEKRLVIKRENRVRDERLKPLEDYRNEELRQMKTTIYNSESDYHKNCYNFVYKITPIETPSHLVKHR
ncbi:hypothetical protein H6G91_35215 [Nostoc muscorum FACHB-395]|nr:hypothetical protein [Desmonostoc muscorum FACHB-395]